MNYSTFESNEMLETQLLTALPPIDEAMTSDPAIYPPPEARARLRVTQPRSLEDSRVENRMWARFRTGQ